MPDYIIHIGANKTGSTTLQRHLFGKFDGLVYLGEDGPGYEQYKDAVNSMIADDDLYYLREPVERLFREARLAAGGRKLLYSSEDIMTSRVPSQCARRLADLLPGAAILLVIRNQLTAVPSFYANHGAYLKQVPRRYWRRYVSIEDWLGYCFEFLKYSPLDSYFYRRILSLYEPLFGRQNIHILFYEEFVNAPRAFIRKLSALLAIDPDKAWELVQGRRERRRNTQREFMYHRWSDLIGGRDVSRILPAWLQAAWRQFLAGGPPARIELPNEWRERVARLYQDDNAALMRDFGVDLRAYGYPLPPEQAASASRG